MANDLDVGDFSFLGKILRETRQIALHIRKKAEEALVFPSTEYEQDPYWP